MSVLREGVETVLFLSAAFAQDPAGAMAGVVIGSAVVLLVSMLLMRGTVKLEVGRFFKLSSVLLIVFAAGLAGYGVHELIEAGEGTGVDLGWWAQRPFDVNPPLNPDGGYPPLHENGAVGSILKALVGYDGNPEWLRIMVYLGYWATVSVYTLRKSGS